MSNDYSCPICLKNFHEKWRLDRHMNKKRPCFNTSEKSDKKGVYPNISKIYPNISKIYPNISKIYPNISNKKTPLKKDKKHIQKKSLNSTNSISTYKCKYCNKVYKHKCNLYKHINSLRCKEIPHKIVKNIIKTCKNKEIIKKKEENENNILSTLNNSNNFINSRNTKSSNNSKSVNNNNNFNNTNNNISNNSHNNISNSNNTININLNPFGKENLSSITKEEKIQTLNHLFLAFPKALEQIHYKILDNNNFYLANKNNKNFITYYNGHDFIYEHSSKFKDKLCNNIMEQLEEWFNEYNNKLLKNKKKILKQLFSEFYDGSLDEKYYKEIDKYLLSYSDNIKSILKDTIKKVKKENIKSLKRENIRKLQEELERLENEEDIEDDNETTQVNK